VETTIIAVFLAFLVLQVGVDMGLVLLNLRHVRAVGGRVPTALEGHIDPETAQRSRAYTLANLRFSLARDVWGAVVTLALLFSGLLPWLEATLAGMGLRGSHLFVVFLSVLSGLLAVAGLPFALYRTFAIEARFGFNRMGWRLWLVDRGKGLALAALIGVPLLFAIHGFMSLTGAWWWLWLFGFLVAVQVVMLWLYPALIAPLFNRFVPLPAGELEQRLEALAARAGFRNRGLYVMDASRRSGHSNAYFVGIVRPRIVLFDTLVDKMTADEAAAVLAHEIGHFKLRHIHRRLVWGLAGMLVGLFVLARLIVWPPLFQAFGFAAPSYHAALALLSLGGGAFTFFLQPAQAWLSRRHEYEADRYSIDLAPEPAALKTALIRLGGENLSNLHPHPWYSRWHYSHPTLLERLAAIDEHAKAR
jgi:STE24 endopeptidase